MADDDTNSEPPEIQKDFETLRKERMAALDSKKKRLEGMKASRQLKASLNPG